MAEQSKLDAFGQRVADRLVDADAGVAEIFDLDVKERRDKPDKLLVLCRRTSGRTFTESLVEPTDPQGTSGLEVLLRFTGVDANSLEKLVGERVPAAPDPDGDWRIDWPRLERALADRSAEG